MTTTTQDAVATMNIDQAGNGPALPGPGVLMGEVMTVGVHYALGVYAIAVAAQAYHGGRLAWLLHCNSVRGRNEKRLRCQIIQ